MPLSDAPQAIRARYVFPVDGPPIENGVVCWQGDRLQQLGDGFSTARAEELGNVAVLPGLVNTHTHLEFSRLDEPLGNRNMPFADWIGAVVAWRRKQAETGQAETGQAETGQAESAQAVQPGDESLAAGLAESLAAGVTLLGEIATRPWPPETALVDPVPVPLVFQELLGLSEERVEPLLALARRHLDSAKKASRSRGDWHAGLSPHAPYTVHWELLEHVVRMSARRACVVAMHLAETLEEIELLAAHSGPLVQRLQQLEAWYPQAIPRGIQPGDYLRKLSEAHRVLVVHGNYLSEADWQLLAAARDRMSVTYCPRTHDYFGHGRYPLARMLAAGVRVALGTDSRASNPDLDLLAEACFVARHHPDVAPADVLRLATLAGAEALGMSDSRGSLAVGKRADMVVVELPEQAAGGDPHELLWRDLPRRRRVYLGGRIVFNSLETGA